MFRKASHTVISVSQAEKIAIKALTFLASEPDQMATFMNLTGMEPADIAQTAGSSFFQAALLEHLMRDETLLLTFCGNENIDPAIIAPAHQVLSGPESS